MFIGCYKGVLWVTKKCSKGVLRVFQGCFKDVSRMFQGSFKGVSRKIKGCSVAKWAAFLRSGSYYDLLGQKSNLLVAYLPEKSYICVK